MRVAFIHPFLYRYPRGIERFTICLANGLARRGQEVELLTWRWPQPIHIGALDAGVRVRLMPRLRYYAAKLVVPFYLWNLLTKSYDFVWLNFAGYGEAEAVSVMSRLRPTPYGVILHYPFSQVPHRYRELKRYGLARRARTVVSVSEFVADGARQSLGRESVIVTTGVDADHFQPSAARRQQDRAALGLGPEDRVLLTVAALEERKGVQHVINAMPSVLASHPTAKYVVAGEGPFRAALEEQVRAKGLQGAVKLAGATGDIYPFYNAADLFLLLSHGEASPIAPLEAMSMGLPVVAARQRPFDEFVPPECGVLVEEADPSGVASAVNSLLSDAAHRGVMGRAARSRVLALYTWDRIAERYLELCRQ